MRPVNYVLTPATIDSATPREKPFALTDGGGLLLDVLPTGSKVWRFKYHLNGKREKVTIGAYPAVSIEAARDKHGQMRSQVAHGQSPARAKQSPPLERKLAQSRATTFRNFAQRWVEETLFYRSEGYRAQIVRWLDTYIYPDIGDVQLADVQPAEVLGVVDKRAGTAVTAERIRTIVQQIYKHAIRKRLVSTNPAQALRGTVTRPPVRSHRPLNEKELASFWRAMLRQGAHATTIAATKLLFLTMARKTELLRATWSEFDLAIGLWDIPAGRMKAGKAHRVYLSHQAVELLLILKPLTGQGEYVFPSIFRAGVPMGDVTLNHFFKRIDSGVSEFSPDGMRGTAATLLREHGVEPDVVELLLAHSRNGPTVAVDSHAELVPERRRALQFLADRIDQLAAEEGLAPSQAAVASCPQWR